MAVQGNFLQAVAERCRMTVVEDSLEAGEDSLDSLETAERCRMTVVEDSLEAGERNRMTVAEDSLEIAKDSLETAADSLHWEAAVVAGPLEAGEERRLWRQAAVAGSERLGIHCRFCTLFRPFSTRILPHVCPFCTRYNVSAKVAAAGRSPAGMSRQGTLYCTAHSGLRNKFGRSNVVDQFGKSRKSKMGFQRYLVPQLAVRNWQCAAGSAQLEVRRI